MAFEIFVDSGANLSREMYKELNIKVISLSFFLGDEEFKGYREDEDFDYPSFYNRLRNGEHVKTSLVNADTFVSEFEKVLEKGDDVLAVVISSGISGTYQAAKIAADTVRERYPERQVIVIDSLSTSIGHGLLIYYAAKMRDEGKTIEEVADWIYKNRLNMVHQFTVDDLFFLKRGGRLSGGVAIIGTILQIKPVMHMDNDGHLIVQNKVNGRKKSINALFDRFKENATDLKDQTIAICHGDCLADAEYLANKIKAETEIENIIINVLDPVIGAHSGPGTLALFYLGKER